MDYNLLGKTSLRLSNLSFGASSLGGVFHSLREADGIKAVHAAVDGGMNFIDVSPYYGFYKAETVLGKALQEIPRSQYYLSTKVGRYGNDGVKSWDYSAAKAKQSVYESMERLHVDYLDIVHVHDIEFSDMNVVVNETLPALAELRTQGVVRHVGITDLQLANLKWVLDRTPAGLVECVLSFCHYCLCDDALADYLDYFEGKGVGVINASPLSMGMLSSRGMPDWHPAPKLLVALCAKAMVRCADRGYPIEKLAMQYAVSNPRITTTLFSTTNPDNVRKNLQWISEPLDHELLAEVRRIISPQARVTWANS